MNDDPLALFEFAPRLLLRHLSGKALSAVRRVSRGWKRAAAAALDARHAAPPRSLRAYGALATLDERATGDPALLCLRAALDAIDWVPDAALVFASGSRGGARARSCDAAAARGGRRAASGEGVIGVDVRTRRLRSVLDDDGAASLLLLRGGRAPSVLALPRAACARRARRRGRGARRARVGRPRGRRAGYRRRGRAREARPPLRFDHRGRGRGAGELSRVWLESLECASGALQFVLATDANPLDACVAALAADGAGRFTTVGGIVAGDGDLLVGVAGTGQVLERAAFAVLTLHTDAAAAAVIVEGSADEYEAEASSPRPNPSTLSKSPSDLSARRPRARCGAARRRDGAARRRRGSLARADGEAGRRARRDVLHARA